MRMSRDKLCLVVFFFQAEDGIRDLVTGVQTCALPILIRARSRSGSESGNAGKIGGAVERGDGGLRKLNRRESVGVPEGGVGTAAGCSLNLVGSNVQAVLLSGPVRADRAVWTRGIVVSAVYLARHRHD